MSLLKLFIAFVVFSCSGLALAEGGCPPGYLPSPALDFTGCAPVYTSAPSSDVSSFPNPPNPGPRWQFRWGAIAIDHAKGKFGGVNDISDVRKARKAAVKLCRKNGGAKCKIALEYYNQCGALVWGAERYVAFRGPVPDEVIKRGIDSCNKLTSNCQIYYMGCSYPVEVD